MAHNNTLFAQMLSLIPRHEIQLLEGKYKCGRSSRQFGFKQQLAVVPFIHLAAKTIADIYKDLWRIESVFKEIKQNLHIKKFAGTSENAVWIQLYTALIAYLLLAYMKFMAGFRLSVQQLLQLTQLNLLGTASRQELLAKRRTQKNLFIDYLLLNSIPR